MSEKERSDYNYKPAFPLTQLSIETAAFTGMTIREYWIGQVLAGTATNSFEADPEFLAERAIKLVDAVIKLLDKSKA